LALALVLALALALALALVLALALALALALVLALVLVLALALALALVLALVLVLALAPALRTPAVYLTAAASVQESEVAGVGAVEQAQLRVAVPRQHWVLRAEEHHLRQLRTTQYPAQLSVPEISNSSQIVPLRCSELQTREETKERASLFDMEFSQPLRAGPALEDYCFTLAESKALICWTPSLRPRVGRSRVFLIRTAEVPTQAKAPAFAPETPDRMALYRQSGSNRFENSQLIRRPRTEATS
jgi:hypothetical protein